jgi:hypothetical protein
MNTPICTRFAGLAGALLMAGCASTQLDAQWVDPQLANSSLRGAKVLVACEAAEAVVKRICQDRLAAEVTAHGATPVMAAQSSLDWAASAWAAAVSAAASVYPRRLAAGR